jgi:hypothetical protein
VLEFVAVIVADAASLWSMSLLNKTRITETVFDVSPQLLQRRYLVTNSAPRTVQYVIAGPLHRWQVSGILIAEHPL